MDYRSVKRTEREYRRPDREGENMSKTEEEGSKSKHLHIFVNRQKFDDERVKKEMTGAEIAALVDVPAEKAVVRYEKDQEDIPVSTTVKIKNGEHFLVTRKVVEGGAGV